MAVLPVGIGPVSGYQISRSLRFNSPDSAFLNRTPASASNRQKFTLSFWIKRGALSTNQAIFAASDGTQNNEFLVYLGTGDTLTIQQTVGGTVSGQISCTTNAVYRDSSAWYHLVLAVDTTQATSTNRLFLYVNGVSQTFSSYSVGSSINTWVNNTNAHAIGKRSDASLYLNGYLTEINFIDGQALTPSSFGQTNASTGVWEPVKYTGTYGTNGFYLNFSDNSGTTSTTLGKDSSGNANNWTPNNFSVTAGVGNDSLVDTPTSYGTDTGVGGEVRGNYCTGNPVANNTGTSWNTASMTNGNLEWGSAADNQNKVGVGTIAMTSGKWYWEITIGTNFPSTSTFLGIVKTTSFGLTKAIGVYYRNDGQKVIDGTNGVYGSSYTTGDVIGFAYDADAGTLTCYKNNTSQGTLYSSGSGSSWLPCMTCDNAGVGVTYYNITNFGQRPFAYTAPSGFKALCTQNLPTPTIGATSTTQAGRYFDIELYTGTGSSRSVTGSPFQPDFVWIKGRSGATNHGLYDAVRGVQNQLESNTTTAETTQSTGLTAFNSDGFTVGSLAQLNTNTATYVSWLWNAGGSNATNTNGTITSTVRASTTAGFSIVTYTGTGAVGTVGHGLGVAPEMIIVKQRNGGTNNWTVYHRGVDAIAYSYALYLNSTAARQLSANFWNNTFPTSTVFTLGSDINPNTNTGTYVAYCFAPVAGYSAFGSYTGNGSSDGPFVYTGFRPRWVMIKETVTVSNWNLWDGARNPYNLTNLLLRPNLSAVENTAGSTDIQVDFLSNGFKIRGSSGDMNTNGEVVVYAAFAENPFKYSLAR